MSDSTLGDKIRELREAKNLTVEQLHEKTKIMIAYIEAIESGRWDLLPGQVYLKPFIKSISEVLDINPKELYKLIDSDPEYQPEAESTVTAAEPLKKKFDYRWLFIFGAIIVVAVIIYLVKPADNEKKQQAQTDQEVPAAIITDHKSGVGNRDYSTDLDLVTIENHDLFHVLGIEVSDTVWIMITTPSGTMYNQSINPGRRVEFNVIEPFEIRAGKINCFDLYYDNEKIDFETVLKDKRRINSDDFGSRGNGEG